MANGHYQPIHIVPGIEIHMNHFYIQPMWFGYHLAGNVIILFIFYLIIHKFVSRSIKLNPNQVERMDGYKLIINENDEDNEV